ncbi:uncharacterized protein LOC123302506 [Chrysoperla carnea]|uniref:uncharacterized protein LOC123302506 n=1 Tax=Chrysoperla carnea TaxID=189513 RepID=UPI001D075424|nr:uncharacterized protein LOC123302506 [Chrysoperla carnea]
MALTNSMASVDAAEKEASEVLHSLLSVERIVKQEDNTVNQQQSNNASNQNGTNPQNGTLQWQGNVAITTHSLFEDHFPQTIDEQQVHDVVWQGHTIQVGNGEIKFDAIPQILDEVQETQEPQQTTQQQHEPTIIPVKKSKKVKMKNNLKSSSKTIEKTKKKKPSSIVNWDPTKLEDNVAQVKERFKRGCECQDESCFRGLSAESVYKHRLNIAELTKGEHDMYLMGVTMACLANPDITVRHKERQRLRAQYVYQGRRVCLDAFLYLENCTHYQLKRIRKHVMTHGVAPRVHGNHGKKPHNTFSLDIYQHATEFLKQYLETTTGETNISNSKTPIQLPWDITRKNLHNAYKEYGQIIEPGVKLMGYSTFRHFLKELFPHVRFCKVEPKNNSQVVSNDLNKIQQSSTTHDQQQTTLKSVITGNEVQQVIPLVVSQTTADGSPGQQHQQATFLVAPVSQLIPNGGNLVTMQQSGGGATQHATNTTTFPYQITNTGYVINEQGNIVTTMANQHQSYSFNRM